MIQLIYKKSGFSLIEVIAVLVISGVLVLVGSMGMTSAVKSYLSEKKTVDTVARGQFAIMRITKEFKSLSTVASGQGMSTSIVYDIYRNGMIETHKLSWGGTLGDPLLYDDFSGNGKVVVDQVKNFSLEYFDSYNDPNPKSSWTGSSKAIEVTLELTGADGISSVFTQKITPRNLP